MNALDFTVRDLAPEVILRLGDMGPRTWADVHMAIGKDHWHSINDRIREAVKLGLARDLGLCDGVCKAVLTDTGRKLERHLREIADLVEEGE